MILFLRSAKIFFIALVSLLVLMIAAFSFVLYSTYGLKLAVSLAEHYVPALHIESAQGQLGSSFSIDNLRYQDPQTHNDIAIEHIDLSMNGACLLHQGICLNTVNVKGVNGQILTSQSDETEDETSDNAEGFSLPFSLNIKQLSLNNIDLNIDGNRIQWHSFSSGAALTNYQLALAPTEWKDIDIQLSQAQAAKDTSNPKAFSYDGLHLAPIALPLDISVPQFDVRNLTLHQQQNLTMTSLHLSAAVKENVVEIQRLETDIKDWGKLNLSGTSELFGDYETNLSLTSVWSFLNQQKIDIETTGNLQSLAISGHFSGPFDGAVNAQMSPATHQLPFKLTVERFKGNWPLQSEPDYSFEVDSLSVDGDLSDYQLALKANAQGKSIPAVSLDAQGSGTMESIDLSSLNVNTLGGQIKAILAGNWQSGLDVNSKVTMSDIQFDKFWSEIPGKVNGTVSSSFKMSPNNQWLVNVDNLDIKGDILHHPLNVEGTLKANSGDKTVPVYLSTPKLVIAHGINKVNLSGELDTEWNLNLDVNVADLSKSIPNTTGQVLGKVALSGPADNPLIDINMGLHRLHWNHLLEAQKATLSGTVHPLKDVSGDLKLTSSKLKYENHKIPYLDAFLKGELKDHRFELKTQYDQAKLITHVQGSVAKDFSSWQGLLQRVEVAEPSVMVKLDKPTKVSVNINQPQIKIAPHCWLQGDASLCLTKEALITTEQADALWEIKHINLAAFAPLFPVKTELSGIAQGKVFVHWEKDQAPNADVLVKVSKGQLQQKRQQDFVVGWNSMVLDGTLRKGRLKSQLVIDVTDNGRVSADVTIPDVQAAERRITGDVNIDSINLAFLNAYLDQFSSFDGEVNSQIGFSGALMHPKLTGNLRVKNIKAEGAQFPVEISDGHINMDFSGYKATLLANILTPDGKLVVDGNGNWQNMSRWKLNSRVHSDGLKVNMPPMVRLKAVPDMTLSMTPEKAIVSGSIGLPEGFIKVEELPDSAVTVSDDEVIIDKNRKPKLSQSALPFEMETDVKVNIGDDFHIQAFGLNADLAGLLSITQKNRAPFISGEVNILNGSYRSFGQDLVIQQGKVILNGAVDKPYVSITAIRNPDNIQDDVTAGIKVSGPADNPAISVFSDPSMSQSNALSYLLRGQSLDAQSDGDTSMTTALIGLSLAQSGRIVGDLGRAVGVQDLQLDTKGSGEDSQVTVSGYVLPGLEVKYGVGIFTSIGEFTLRYRFMKNLYVEAVSGLTSTVDLLYQFEFN